MKPEQLNTLRRIPAGSVTRVGVAGMGVGPTPWLTRRADLGDVKRIRVHPGSIDGVVPTNIFAPLTITGTGVEYVLLTTTASGGRLVSAALSVAGTVPDSLIPTQDSPPDTLVDVIAVIADGTLYQIRSRNLRAISQLVMEASATVAEPWRDNLIRFYRWSIQEAI